MKLLIQAGHEGRTTGATGAPGEQAFTKDVANKVADKLRALGVEVKRINADPTAADVAGDWDLCLAIHYDADTYNADGGFTDYPEPSTDGATAKSQAIAKTLADEYFPKTGIKNVPGRSNANTRFYYLWKMISGKTPCVIIECGVGNRKPKDFEPLNTNRDLVVTGLVAGLSKALNISGGTMPETITVNKSDWDRLLKASKLGDRLINGKGYAGNIADKDEGQIDLIIAKDKQIETDKNNAQAELNKVPALIEQADKQGYDRGFKDGAASNPGTNPTQPVPPIDMTKYEENGLTIEKTVDNTKYIVNYKKIV